MIALFSRWKLKDGCPPEFQAVLHDLTAKVLASEPGTLMFSWNLPASQPPIGPPPTYEVCNDPDLVRPPEKGELVFFEVYRDAEAFSAHLRGTFQEFMTKHRDFFFTPWQGHPRPETVYLDPQSLFVRSALAPADTASPAS